MAACVCAHMGSSNVHAGQCVRAGAAAAAARPARSARRRLPLLLPWAGSRCTCIHVRAARRRAAALRGVPGGPGCAMRLGRPGLDRPGRRLTCLMRASTLCMNVTGEGTYELHACMQGDDPCMRSHVQPPPHACVPVKGVVGAVRQAPHQSARTRARTCTGRWISLGYHSGCAAALAACSAVGLHGPPHDARQSRE